MKTLLPHYQYNQFIKPPEGYFILPLGEFVTNEKVDKFYYLNEWSVTCCSKSGVKLVKNDCTYARPIKGNEELYNQMAFLPEQIIDPPEGYYLLPANEKFKDGDIGYINGEWKPKDHLDIGYNEQTRLNPIKNYNKWKNEIGLRAIAFARKIENNKIMKKDYNNKGLNVKVTNQDQFDKVVELAKKYGFSNSSLTFNYCLKDLEEKYFYLVFYFDYDSFAWNPSPYDSKNNDVYNDYTLQEIEEHFKAIRKCFKPDGFQVLLKTQEEIKEFLELTNKYGYIFPYSKTLNCYYFILNNEVTWNYGPNDMIDRDTYRELDKDTIEKYFRNNKIMNTQNDKKVEIVDYAKFPNFAVKIKNDENTKVMLAALAKKYGFTEYDSGHTSPIYFYIVKELINVDFVYRNKIYGTASNERFITEKSHKFYTYETPDWPAIIKHFEAKVVEEKALPIVHGYTMVYERNNVLIIFGCARISIELLRNVVKNTNGIGNRYINSIELDSGKVITKEQIKEILDYVDWTNKNG